MSIFSINDNSNYGSILSQAKANKESKENSKISFANSFLKQNASKLNEIQNANSQTLARSEVLNSTNTTNTSNNTNFSISSKTSSPNYDISSEFKNSIYTLKYKQADISNTSTNTAYGYSVDKDGYMGSDFNKAAGLPEDFKIHKSTLDEIERKAENNSYTSDIKKYLGIDKYYTNIDMADTIKQYYNQFNQIVNHTFNDTNKTSFTEADINSMPKGISELSSDKTIGIMPKNYDKLTITNYYNTQEQYNEAEQLGMFGHINIGLQPLNFTPQSMQTQNLDKDTAIDTFNPDMSVYPKNEDGSYSKEALFMSFLKSYGSGQPVESPKTTLNPKVEAYNRAMAKESFDGSLASLDDIMTGKVDFASLLKGYAQDGWLDAGIYAMEKGVKWQNVYVGSGISFDREFHQAKANGWKASSQSIDSYVGSIMDRLNNLIGQARV
ncbi:Cj0814 family flagellar-dependent secreted protein [Campylobacter jejuni]|uniref:Cj0814 family flagellar-dependent secreted protein n=1 Tax=Campylobacter jejuni TaxID=197 RepID=UPI0011A6820D